jgi:hypothetical protein
MSGKRGEFKNVDTLERKKIPLSVKPVLVM